MHIFVITHGNYGRELINTARMIVGDCRNVEAIGIHPGENFDTFKDKMLTRLKSIPEGVDILAFTDLFGGSPSNVMAFLTREFNFKCITGVNLPMLLEALTCDPNLSFEEIVSRCKKMGRDGIKDLGEKLQEV